ncbi:hypothetical protein FGO68_gene8165 [Halteria grandinella]|uniref:Uncharacterized protein n=1 Tax=Halteria grandinella TaxID=5974 RepID=A0A8J8NW48_HALGN|nr:hypothetical protein FGO68_gene8165 [Halteria grandinella]
MGGNKVGPSDPDQDPSPIKQRQVWQNLDTGKYYMIEEEFTPEGPQASARQRKSPRDQCMLTHIAKDGSLPNYCDPHVTGFANFKRRMELSIEATANKLVQGENATPQSSAFRMIQNKSTIGNYQSNSPMRAVAGRIPSTTYTGPRDTHYIPRIDKFDGYYHFPSPMVLPYANKIDPNKLCEAEHIKRQQLHAVKELLIPSTTDEVTPSILNKRNREVIKRFAEKINLMSQGLKDDVIGKHIPHFTGTRTGFNFKAQSHREQVIKSITKHIPDLGQGYNNEEEQDSPTLQGQTRNKSLNSIGERKPLTEAQKAQIPLKLKIEKIRDAVKDNFTGLKIHGIPHKQPNGIMDEQILSGRDGLTKRSDGSPSSRMQANKTQMHFGMSASKFGQNSLQGTFQNRSNSQIGSSRGGNSSRRYGNGEQGKQGQSLIYGYSTLKEAYSQQPENLIKSFIEGAKERQKVSIQGEVMLRMLQDESQWNNQPHFNFAQTSMNGFQVYQQKFTRTGGEAKFNQTQKKLDEESSIAQSIIIEPRIKAMTKGRFGGPNLFLNTPAINFSKDKSWQIYANPEANESEVKYLTRDRYLLEKRRYQRVLKEIQCEQQAGVKGVTKMPPTLVKSLENAAAQGLH